MFKKIKDKPWYSMATAICIGVVLFVLLNNISDIWNAFKTFLGFFETVIIGFVIAYLINPLAKFAYKHLGKIKDDKKRETVSVTLAYIFVIAFLIVAILILIPQIVESIELFAANINSYATMFDNMLEELGVSSLVDISGFISSSENTFSSISKLISQNSGKIVTTVTGTGKSVFQFVIAFFVSIYLLAEKDNLKSGLERLSRAIFDEYKYKEVSVFADKCNLIFNRYIVYNFIDAIIVGVSNAVFMSICGMEYVGLISYVVAITNLVPTFGPIVGAVIGGFVLLMISPIHALIFLIFTLVLQTVDGYVIKPHLFGTSLGVSSLWILVSIIVGSRMFGVVGILLAVPCVAIIILIYETYLLPWLEKRSALKKNQVSKGC